jgi:hypothetical protein
MTAAAKRGRINNFICGRSLNDPGVPNGAVASLLQIDVSNIRRQAHVELNKFTPRHDIRIAQKVQRHSERAKKDLKRSNKKCGCSL